MSELSEFQVKAPVLDAPKIALPESRPMSNGTKVALFSQGIQVNAQITAVQRLGKEFVGRVLAFSPLGALPNDMTRGDYIRFSRRDVHRIE